MRTVLCRGIQACAVRPTIVAPMEFVRFVARSMRRSVCLAVRRVDLHVAERPLAGNELGGKRRHAAVDVGDRPGLRIEQRQRERLRLGARERVVAAA